MSDAAASRRLRVTLTDGAGHPIRAGALAAWLRGVAPARARGLVTIALVSDATMRRLNRRFAGSDRATDVLSFPADTAPARPQSSTPGNRPRGGQPEAARHSAASVRVRLDWVTALGRTDVHPLGDIVIATGVAMRQARDAGHAYSRELRVLALHGLLHLLGYDHHADEGVMARVEARLRRKGGLTAGLIERAGQA